MAAESEARTRPRNRAGRLILYLSDISLPAISAATAATTTTMSAAFLSRGHRTGFSDGHISPAIFNSVEFLNGIRGFLIGRHFHESKSLTPARIAIGDDLGGLNASCLSKDFLE